MPIDEEEFETVKQILELQYLLGQQRNPNKG
jgi:hypothetical protein